MFTRPVECQAPAFVKALIDGDVTAIEQPEDTTIRRFSSRNGPISHLGAVGNKLRP